MRTVIRLPLADWSIEATGGAPAANMLQRVLKASLRSCRSIHTVLARAGVQEPIHALRAELDSEWVGHTEWTFSREIELPAKNFGAHCALRIATIDGPCEVVLAGVVIGTHASAFIPFEARIPDALRGQRALLELRFKAPVTEVLRWQAALGERPVNGDWTPFCFARTAACSFGWDWGPRVPGVGFRAAHCVCWTHARIMKPAVSQRWNDDGSCTVRVDVETDANACGPTCGPTCPLNCVLERSITSSTGEILHFPAGERELTLRPEKCWQPWEHGSRRGVFWRARIIARHEGIVVDERSTRFAFRRVQLDTTTDSIGTRFRVLVNGVPLFAKGANIIPTLLDGTHIRDWRAEMQAYRDTGFNMVRVWGGGKYLSHTFYDACDELGILVWQDFMFACATYPEDEPFASLIAAEARHQVRRLSRHPSIALWCGGNEDILAWWSWGWKERLSEGQSWGKKYWLDTLPCAVARDDAGTPYWAESPYSASMERHPNDPDHGDRHTWDAQAKIEGYRTIVPRFCSEFGHQSPPCAVTLREHFPERALVIGSEALKLRQKAGGGDDAQYKSFLDARFRGARSFDEYVAQTQHLQARAMDVGMRWMRANAPRTMGALIWQWNDVWAGHSWSLVDVSGREKPAWHAVRRACAKQLLSIEPIGASGALEVVLIDDRAFAHPEKFAAQRIEATIERMSFDGTVLASARVALSPHYCGELAAATMRGAIPASVLVHARATHELLVARIDACPKLLRATWFLAADHEIHLPKPRLKELRADAKRKAATATPHEFVGLVAQTVVREFWVEPSERGIETDRESCWRTLVPGDLVMIPSNARWWSANSFCLHQTR